MTPYPFTRGKPASFVASKFAPGDTTHRPLDEMARTLAHELTHYLLKWGDDHHADDKPWNLFAGGEHHVPGKSRDLDSDQWIRFSQSGVNPATPDL